MTVLIQLYYIETQNATEKEDDTNPDSQLREFLSNSSDHHGAAVTGPILPAAVGVFRKTFAIVVIRSPRRTVDGKHLLAAHPRLVALTRAHLAC